MGSKSRRAMIQIQDVPEEHSSLRAAKLGTPPATDYTMCDPSVEIPFERRPLIVYLRLVGTYEQFKRTLDQHEPFYDWAVAGQCEPTV